MKHDPNTPPHVAERREKVERVLGSKISTLLEEVYKASDETGGSEALEIAKLISSFSGLAARLGEEAERKTKHLVWLTWGLLGLTVMLLLFTAYLTYDAYEHRKAEKPAQKSSAEKP